MASPIHCWNLDSTGRLYGSLVLVSLIFAAYLFMTRNFKHWIKKGVIEIPPTPFLGNFTDCVLSRKSVGEFTMDMYNRGKGLKYMGFYIFDKPYFMPRDPALIKHILIRDFNNFMDRPFASTQSDALGTANLFSIKNPHWKHLRNKLTPIFSSGKMKKMFDLMATVTVDLDTHLEALMLQCDEQVVELKEMCARYTTDVIASCAFGLKGNSLIDGDAAFRSCGREMFASTYRRLVEALAFLFAPSLVEPMGFKLFGKNCGDFLRNTFWDTVKARIRSGEHRNDLIDTLIELKNDQTKSDDGDPEAFKFEGDNLVAQAAIFFVAGFDTSATTMTLSMYELALQPDLQTRVRDEITSALEESGGKLTYENAMNLPYLDMVISETLRKYPPLQFLGRMATCDYNVPDTDIIIEKGTPVYISVSGLHHDPEYFSEPEKYDPERFNRENKPKITPFTYMPFGEGPHNCIGRRFGLLQAKLGLIKIFADYEVMPCTETPVPIRFDPKGLLIKPEGNLYLNMRKIQRGQSKDVGE